MVGSMKVSMMVSYHGQKRPECWRGSDCTSLVGPEGRAAGGQPEGGEFGRGEKGRSGDWEIGRGERGIPGEGDAGRGGDWEIGGVLRMYVSYSYNVYVYCACPCPGTSHINITQRP